MRELHFHRIPNAYVRVYVTMCVCVCYAERGSQSVTAVLVPYKLHYDELFGRNATASGYEVMDGWLCCSVCVHFFAYIQ